MAVNNAKPWESTPTKRLEGAQERRRVLIVCEDSKSSCFYFKGFKIDRARAEVVAVGTGMNTDSLVEQAIQLKKAGGERKQPYSEIWCVLDRDTFPLKNYERAFQLADPEKIKIAWANEAFELWYLLHFNYHDTALSRDSYKEKLKPHFAYDKADKQIYDKLRDHQPNAFKYARKLEKYWNELEMPFPRRENPSTNIHRLVEFLNELCELGSVD